MKTPEIDAAIAIACSALLSAPLLSFSPINLAMEAVTPEPRPIVRPSIKKKIGILNATPAIASPPKRPINNISTILYRVCIPIPNIIGIANVHNAFCGSSRKEANLDLEFDSIEQIYRLKKIFEKKGRIKNYNIYIESIALLSMRSTSFPSCIRSSWSVALNCCSASTTDSVTEPSLFSQNTTLHGISIATSG